MKNRKYNSDICEENIWRCECAGEHFLSVSLWKWDDDPYDGYIEMSDEANPAFPELTWGNLKERVKAALQALRGRRHCWTLIDLSPKTCGEIIEQLSKVKKQLEEHGHKTDKEDK